MIKKIFILFIYWFIFAYSCVCCAHSSSGFADLSDWSSGQFISSRHLARVHRVYNAVCGERRCKSCCHRQGRFPFSCWPLGVCHRYIRICTSHCKNLLIKGTRVNKARSAKDMKTVVTKSSAGILICIDYRVLALLFNVNQLPL